MALTETLNDAIDAVLQPIASATGLPNEAYTSDSHFLLERDAVLGASWSALWFASDLPRPGYVKPIEFMGLPLVILRNRGNEIRVFHNVCSHRGMILVHDEMSVQGALRCKYHSWSYNLDGELLGTPHFGGIGEQKHEGFDRCLHGLKEVRSTVWMDIVFINLSGDAPGFDAHAAALIDQWRPFLGDDGYGLMRAAVNGKGLEIDVESNWKLAVENYCESYHLPWIHPSLNAYSRLEDHYHIMIGDDFGGQGSLAYRLSDEAGTALPRFPAWPRDRLKQAEYIAFYPNVLLGIQADHAFVMIIEPLNCRRSREHLRLYYVGDEALADEHAASRNATLESWRVVFAEDVDAVEGMQRGRRSPGYRGGLFSPVMDNPTHHFHSWVARRLRDAGGRSG